MTFTHNSILVYDIETDSLKKDNAQLKWFGAYSYLDNEYYLLQYKDKKDIISLIERHKVLVGFNNKEFDNPIIQNYLNDENLLQYKIYVDLFEISSSKANCKNGKNFLAQMGFKLKNFKLSNIINVLKLDDESKGDIDYNIFKKDDWILEEIIEIKKYLKQDIDLTKKLFEWYEKQFEPLKKFLNKKEQDKFFYMKVNIPVLAYYIICNRSGLKFEFGEKVENAKSYSGGHHIVPRWNIVKGNIIEIDFVSAYPHALMMCNLYSLVNEDGWNGDGFYKIEGIYNNKELGKIETVLKEIFIERLNAKKEGNKVKNLSYKLIINSLYGMSGNPVFKSIYNRKTASDCTSVVRTWMKKLAKTLEENGFTCLYGFTDSIFVSVPEYNNKQELMFIVNKFMDKAKSHTPFPMDTFKMDIEDEIKMIWFVAKNCYLYVNSKNEIKYKSTLLNTNTPKAILKLFDEYMRPIIINTLSIPFTEKELENKLKELLNKDISLAAQEYRTSELSEYKVSTSLHYQITERYGEGRHYLIPNKRGIGVGLQKSTKKKIGIRHCTIEEFKSNNLTVNDISLNHLMSHLKTFYELNNDNINKEKQCILI